MSAAHGRELLLHVQKPDSCRCILAHIQGVQAQSQGPLDTVVLLTALLQNAQIPYVACAMLRRLWKVILSREHTFVHALELMRTRVCMG
jgi:hypothetical protein